MWKKMDERAVSPVVGVMLMVLITVVLACVLRVWVTRTVPSTTDAPVVIGMNSTVRDNDGSYVNITWKVVAVSRVDIKWSDITIKCFASGAPLTKTTTASPATGEFYVKNKPIETYCCSKCFHGKQPIETYVECAQTITIEFNADDLGGSTGGKTAEINLVYIPTHSIAGMHTVVVPKAKA